MLLAVAPGPGAPTNLGGPASLPASASCKGFPARSSLLSLDAALSMFLVHLPPVPAPFYSRARPGLVPVWTTTGQAAPMTAPIAGHAPRSVAGLTIVPIRLGRQRQQRSPSATGVPGTLARGRRLRARTGTRLASGDADSDRGGPFRPANWWTLHWQLFSRS